jgi:RNA polymerase sigma factor (sigma-70 family)
MPAVRPLGTRPKHSGVRVALYLERSFHGVEDVIASQKDVEAVYRSHGGLVWRAVLAMSAGDRGVADEATAEAFARLVRYREKVRDPAPWVFRTAYRLAQQELGRKSGSVSSQDRPEPTGRDTSLVRGELVEALRALSPPQRVAVFLFYVADMPVGEIARLTGASGTAVRLRLHRGRAKLRESFIEEGGADHVGALD